jgi:predicted metal-binding membrane protein
MISTQIRSRDKFAIGAVLALLSFAAWISTVYQSQAMAAPMETRMEMGANTSMSSMMEPEFSPLQFMLFLSTWVVMMAAMMLPSTAPMVMTYAAVSQQRRSRHLTYAPIGLFVLGYLLAWGGTGVLAYAVSILLPVSVMAFPELQSHAVLFGGAILVLAGAYQFSSLKTICLSHCRTPMGFVLSHWREGRSGALHMGWDHGLYCIGCCWALMAILFVVGVMNLAWMALLALFMFVGKVSRRGLVVGKVVGILLIIAGIVMAARSIL